MSLSYTVQPAQKNQQKASNSGDVEGRCRTQCLPNGESTHN